METIQLGWYEAKMRIGSKVKPWHQYYTVASKGVTSGGVMLSSNGQYTCFITDLKTWEADERLTRKFSTLEEAKAYIEKTAK